MLTLLDCIDSNDLERPKGVRNVAGTVCVFFVGSPWYSLTNNLNDSTQNRFSTSLYNPVGVDATKGDGTQGARRGRDPGFWNLTPLAYGTKHLPPLIFWLPLPPTALVEPLMSHPTPFVTNGDCLSCLSTSRKK